MAKTGSFGTEYIKCGAIPTSGAEAGGMATVLAALGTTYKGSATITKEDDPEFEVFAEEFNDPEEIYTTGAGAEILGFSLTNFDPNLLKTALGGTVSVDGLTWSEPLTPAKIEMSFEVKQKTGLIIQYPRMRVRAKAIPGLGQDAPGTVQFLCRKMQPAKAGLAARAIIVPAVV